MEDRSLHDLGSWCLVIVVGCCLFFLCDRRNARKEGSDKNKNEKKKKRVGISFPHYSNFDP